MTMYLVSSCFILFHDGAGRDLRLDRHQVGEVHDRVTGGATESGHLREQSDADREPGLPGLAGHALPLPLPPEPTRGALRLPAG
jgi:hypothetical protein